jgi:phospholipid/cholesterol/gamma-HCH transport system permease protein
MGDPTGKTGSVRRTDEGEGVVALAFEGRFTFAGSAASWEQVRAQAEGPATELKLDLSGLESLDGGTAALLVQLKQAKDQVGVPTSFVGASGPVGAILDLYDMPKVESLRPPPSGQGLLVQIGAGTRGLVSELKLFFGFQGAWLRSMTASFKAPGTVDWSGVRPIFEQAGADALPIVCLINFLVGFILAFQAAAQLHQFGADIFVADLVGLSVAREMGPLMTAIIVAGRSGAAFAASLGTMKVSEEIDALTTLGFDPIRHLVFPRAIAMVLVLPLLTLIADLVAILGGLMVGTLMLDLTVQTYVTQTVAALGLWDVYSGVVKSVVFALAITLIACQQGLATSGGAEGVGRRTTSSVVAILFSLILIDAAFTVLFFVYGL